MEEVSFVVPAGREFLWRGGILGVPGVLDGLSHVVSVGLMRGRGGEISDVSGAATAVTVLLSFC